jgi:hypothetical protein
MSFLPEFNSMASVPVFTHKDEVGFMPGPSGPRVFTSDTFEEFAFMAKKKDKVKESKIDKTEKSKAESFLDNLRPTTGKSEHTRGTGNTKVESKKTVLNDKTRKAVAGGIVAAALGALTLAGLNFAPRAADDAVVQPAAPAAALTQEAPARAASEAAAASMLPQPLAPQKTRLAAPTKSSTEVAKPSKTSTKKSGKLASKTKGKETVKKSVASSKKQKATKKSKKTLAAKSID